MNLPRILKLLLASVHRGMFLMLYLLFGALIYKHLEERSYDISFHWAITSLSTVGYGAVTPISEKGKTFTCFYCLFGIPLFFYTLTAWGRLLNYLIRLLIGTTERLLCKHGRITFVNCKTFFCLFILFILQLCIYSAIDNNIKPEDYFHSDQSFKASFYVWVISLFSIGYGDAIPFHMEHTALLTILTMFGMATIVAMVLAVADANEAKRGMPVSILEMLIGIYDRGNVPAISITGDQVPLSKESV